MNPQSLAEKSPRATSSTTLPARYSTIRVAGVALISVILMTLVTWIANSFWRPSDAQLRDELMQAAASRNWTRAEEIAAKWTAMTPDSGEAWIQRSLALFKQQKYEDALDCLNRISLTSPEAERALTARMSLQFGPLNRPVDGAATCEKIIQSNPRSMIARQQLILFLAITLQRTRLMHEIRSAIDAGVEPADSSFYLFFIDVLPLAAGAELNRQFLSGDPRSELFEVAEATFRTEALEQSYSLDDREKAEEIRRAIAEKSPVMENLLAKYPHNTELLAYNIRKRMQKGDVAGVVKLMAMAPIEAESDHRFWRFKGWVHAQQDEPDDAEKAYRQAIQRHPLDWTTRHLLAELLQQQRRFDEVKSLRELIRRANELRKVLQFISDDRQVSPETLSQLAQFASDCGDEQLSNSVRRRLHRKGMHSIQSDESFRHRQNDQRVFGE